ncbi:MAG: glycine cleavage system protein H, partial [Acidobacteria bacterium]|nr:glycine cleavage system protein H [Acidobacteriota bacterium]
MILVLGTFLIFILLDYILNRKKPVQTGTQPAAAPGRASRRAYIDGFLVPDRLAYHPGHGWVVRERRNLHRVGVDEFAAALAGRLEKIELPKPGQWVRQGQRAFAFFRRGERCDVVCPTEGEVVEINSDVVADPSLLRKDPYGEGWLMTLYVPDEETTTRNMVPKPMVARWMQEAVERLYARQKQLAGAVAADGG